jgi:hypothetical protein
MVSMGLLVAGCSSSANGPPADGGADAGADSDSDSDSDTATDTADATAEVGLPPACAGLTGVTLAAPRIESGALSPGGSAMVTLTMSDSDTTSYVSYVGAVITTTTPGVSLPWSQVSPPGSLIDSKASKPITFTVNVDPSVAPGGQADFSARVFGWGHPDPACTNAFALSFSLPIR